MKRFFALLLVLSSLTCHSSEGTNEEKVYFHIHQATHWAELHYSKNTVAADQQIRNHLGKIKYGEVHLVKSLFYQDFLFLNKLSINMSNGSHQEIEKLRTSIHAKAEKFQIKHPDNWQDEFTLVQ